MPVDSTTLFFEWSKANPLTFTFPIALYLCPAVIIIMYMFSGAKAGSVIDRLPSTSYALVIQVHLLISCGRNQFHCVTTPSSNMGLVTRLSLFFPLTLNLGVLLPGSPCFFPSHSIYFLCVCSRESPGARLS